MLQGTEKRRPLGWSARGLIVILLAASALLLSGLGGETLLPAAEEPAGKIEPFELGYLHANSKGLLAIRPALCFKQPGMEKASQMLDTVLGMLKQFGVTWPPDFRPEHIDQIVTDVHIQSAGTGKPGSRSLMFGTSSVFVRMDKGFDWAACMKSLTGELKKIAVARGKDWKDAFEKFEELERDGVVIYRLGALPALGPGAMYMHVRDRRSAVFSFASPKKDEKEFRDLLANAGEARKRKWGAAWKKVEFAPVAVVLDNQTGHYTKQHANDLKKKDLDVMDKVSFATVGVELGDGKPVRLILEAKSGAGSTIGKAMEGYARLVLKEIDKIQSSAHMEVNVSSSNDTGPNASQVAPAKTSAGDPEDRLEKMLLKLTTELVQSRKSSRHGPLLEWQGFSAIRLHDFVETIAAETAAKTR